MSRIEHDSPFEARLKAQFSVTGADRDAAARIARVLATTALPRQRGAWRWPTVLLDWDFTPAWPRVAALAACAGFGFVIGFAGLDSRIDEASAAIMIASSDLPSLVGDAEPLTGLRP